MFAASSRWPVFHRTGGLIRKMKQKAGTTSYHIGELGVSNINNDQHPGTVWANKLNAMVELH